MAMNRVKIEICGTPYLLAVEGEPEYYEELAKDLNAKMQGLLDSSDRITVTGAAVLTALDYLDELRRSNDGADNLRSQLKGYLEDALSAKATAENAARELRELTAQLERSRMECDRLRREVGYMRGQDM
ncbi:MAG: cell division protein ZapA [Oscillospiraceae bacterium]|nr:cell division protein ZapA [Oscillospiraceae bacterium]